MKNLLITICARGGSKGIPKKNIKLLDGKHLISYTIRHAYEIKKWFEKERSFFVKIELSTDTKEIKKVAELYGLKTNYLRPGYLANDTAGKLDVIKDLLIFSENHDVSYDYLLDLDVSAPMRTIEDLKKGFDILNSNINAKNLFSVSDASKNPYFNMVEKNKEGFYTLSKTSKNVLSRQLAPKVFEMNASFYFYKRDFFNQKVIYLFNNSLIYKMEHESFDLDHLIDFDFLDFLISNNKLTFSI